MAMWGRKKIPGECPGSRSVEKASQSFAPAGAKMIQIIFCGGVYVAENTDQPASVEFLCRRHTNYARGRVQALSNENPAKRFSFESVSKTLF